MDTSTMYSRRRFLQCQCSTRLGDCLSFRISFCAYLAWQRSTLLKILMATLLHIDDITPQTENWRVKVFILQKSNVYTNEAGRRLQKLLLEDEQGKKIEGVIWNTNIELLEGNLTPFSTYIIGGADVDTIKEEYKHNSPGHQYQWVLSRTTFIQPVKDHDNMMPCPPIQSTPFVSLRSHVNSGAPVDILAVVVDVKETRYVPVRSKLVPLRECIVIENELKPVTVTLWGDYGHKQGAELFRLRNELPIVLCKGLKASPFSGKRIDRKPSNKKENIMPKCASKLLRKSPEDLQKEDKQATTKLLLNINEQLHSKKLIMEIKGSKKKFNDKITRYTVLNWIEKDQASGSVNEEEQMCSQTTVDSGITTVSNKGKHPEEMESTTQGSDTEHYNSSSSPTPHKKKKKTSSETTRV